MGGSGKTATVAATTRRPAGARETVEMAGATVVVVVRAVAMVLAAAVVASAAKADVAKAESSSRARVGAKVPTKTAAAAERIGDESVTAALRRERERRRVRRRDWQLG